MAFSERIKNFERIRDYMREFFLYGLRSRSEYGRRSLRSYDDEKRRVESWLGGYMGFRRNADGKNVFLSIDSRAEEHNPLYKAWKTSSFTDGDITLHFILFDILADPGTAKTVSELAEEIDRDYLSGFEEPMLFDESTIRKKCREYTALGLLAAEKSGRQVYYRRTETADLSPLADAIDFFSEAAPCGVIGSYLLDRMEPHRSVFSFKHHYITQTMDSDILACLLDAMAEKREAVIRNCSRTAGRETEMTVVPLRIFVSTQNGRQYLLAYHRAYRRMQSFRLDYITEVRAEDTAADFDDLREKLSSMQSSVWGVSCRGEQFGKEHIAFTVQVGEGEEYIAARLEREKRGGTVEKIDEHTYRFSADIYDTGEMIPWIRTFLCRIVSLEFSNQALEAQFRRDTAAMCRLYGLEPEMRDKKSGETEGSA
ncbi:MAG: WYL domain-containing protein [Clostridia bacterium]|nr:WYL domain-containing protein [Clostridia bacterium]